MTFTYELAKRIAPFMRSRGFKRKGKRFYYRLNDIVFCVEFEMPTSFVYVWAYILPLYAPYDFIWLSYGNRLGNMPSIMLPVLNKTAPDEEIADWCNLLCSRIEDSILPIYRSIDTPAKLASYIAKGNEEQYREFICCSEPLREELRIHTALYLREWEQLQQALIRYAQELDNAYYFTAAVIQKCRELIPEMEQLCNSDEDNINAYLAKAKEKTGKLFP